MTLYLIVTLFASALLTWVIIATQNFHLDLTGDGAKSGVQKLHTGIVPRIGGLSVFAAVGFSLIPISADNPNLALDGVKLLLCMLPCFLVGFAEDITKNISPLQRYLATVLSALLFCLLFEVQISYVDVPFLDQLVANHIVGLVFTLFAIGSIAHSFNLIDGQHGLCAGTSIISSTALATVAYHNEIHFIFVAATILATANLGFLIFNYPLGKIFLGDAGAYFNGAVIGVLAVWLSETSDQISPWFSLTVLIYPVWETLFSMFRRIINGQSISQPDSNHLHSLMHKVDRRTASLMSKSSAPRMWAFNTIICGLGTTLPHSTFSQIVICLAFLIVYSLAYNRFSKSASL